MEHGSLWIRIRNPELNTEKSICVNVGTLLQSWQVRVSPPFVDRMDFKEMDFLENMVIRYKKVRHFSNLCDFDGSPSHAQPVKMFTGLLLARYVKCKITCTVIVFFFAGDQDPSWRGLSSGLVLGAFCRLDWSLHSELVTVFYGLGQG